MADLPIASDEGATPVVINDPTTTANVANVKAASTASVAGDSSLVVALSPNSPVPAGTNSMGSVSLGTSTGKSNVLKTGTLVTTATTTNQVVLTYTVTSGKTFYLEYVSVNCALTTAPTNFNTPVVFGTISLETPSGTKDISWRWMGPNPQTDHITFSEPVPIAAGVVVRIVTTPGITTSLTWIGNFGGYER